jgi:hypothetical protein
MDQILKLLHKDTGPATHLYVLVDGAQAMDAPYLRTILFHSGIPKTSLLTEKAIYDGIEVAPFLIILDDRQDIERQLIVQGWGKRWGIFLTSVFDMDILLAHFRLILHRDVSSGRIVFFRFYDPIVLADYLPLLTAKEAVSFFGPVKRFVFESKNGLPLEFEKPESGSGMSVDGYSHLFDPQKAKALNASWNKRQDDTECKDNKLTFLNRQD